MDGGARSVVRQPHTDAAGAGSRREPAAGAANKAFGGKPPHPSKERRRALPAEPLASHRSAARPCVLAPGTRLLDSQQVALRSSPSGTTPASGSAGAQGPAN